MDEHGECEHTGGILNPEWCDMCINGIIAPKKAKASKQKKKQRPVLNADPEMALLQDYLSGARCMVCDGLRTGPAKQCWHVRAQIVQENIEAIEAFAEANPDIKGKLTQTAASAAIRRVTLRGALQNAPSEIDGLSVGGLLGLVSRTSKGRNMEWSRDQRSGDEVPV